MSPASLEPEDVPNWLAIGFLITALVGLVYLVRISKRAVRFVRNSLSRTDADLPQIVVVKYVRDDGTEWTERHCLCRAVRGGKHIPRGSQLRQRVGVIRDLRGSGKRQEGYGFGAPCLWSKGTLVGEWLGQNGCSAHFGAVPETFATVAQIWFWVYRVYLVVDPLLLRPVGVALT